MKKNLLTVLILALLVVNIVLTSVMMFSVINTNKKTAELVGDIATALKLELTVPGQTEPAASVSLADTTIHNFDGAVTIPLTSENEKQSYIVFNVSLSMNSKHKDFKTYGETISDKEGLMKDTITSVVGAYTETECRDNFEAIKEEILEALQALFESDFIYKVAISEVKYGG